MNKERYQKFEDLMEAIKDIPYVDVSISDYDSFIVAIKLEEETETEK